MDEGMVRNLSIEANNDYAQYQKVATQDNFDKF